MASKVWCVYDSNGKRVVQCSGRKNAKEYAEVLNSKSLELYRIGYMRISVRGIEYERIKKP